MPLDDHSLDQLLSENAYRIPRIEDFNLLFQRSNGAVILNKFDQAEAPYRDNVLKQLYGIQFDQTKPGTRGSRVKMSEFNYIPSCDCKHYEGGAFMGLTCPKCKTTVVDPLIYNNGIIPITTWVSLPDNIKGALHPIAYNVLSKWLSYKPPGDRKTVSYIDIILNPSLPVPDILIPVFNNIPGRGFNYFYDNFDYLMSYFANHLKKGTREDNRRRVEANMMFIQKFRHLLFTKYFPALSKALHTVTTADGNESGRPLADKTSEYILNAANTLAYLSLNPPSERKKHMVDVHVHDAVMHIYNYYAVITKTKFSSKPSLLRQHIFGTRFNNSFRGVIVPIVKPHQYDEVHLPWQLAVQNLKPFIISVLINHHGYTVPKALYKHYYALNNYDELVNSIMKGLMEQHPLGKFPIILNRNPSIKRGALQMLFVPTIKTDIHDKSIAISDRIVKAPNADHRL